MSTSTDLELGKKIHAALVQAGIETPYSGQKPLWESTERELRCQEQHGTILAGFNNILHALRLDQDDDSLSETPRRMAKMYCQEIFHGLDYTNFPKCTTVENKMQVNELVAVRDISVTSCCEHHFQAFVGHAHIAYIPDQKVLGLSKFNRVVDFFARRPQIQERLTEQISLALTMILGTEDVAVIIDCEHMCVRLRGAKDQSATVTSRMRGKFLENLALRQEFIELTKPRAAAR